MHNLGDNVIHRYGDFNIPLCHDSVYIVFFIHKLRFPLNMLMYESC
jgi:hypothetical protein